MGQAQEVVRISVKHEDPPKKDFQKWAANGNSYGQKPTVFQVLICRFKEMKGNTDFDNIEKEFRYTREFMSLVKAGGVLGQITPQLALKVLLQFDKAINTALANRVKNKINFKGKLNTYRFCDNVWTFVLNNVEFQEMQEIAKVDKVKIVACDGKGAEK